MKVHLFEQNGSGWILNKCIGSDVRVSAFELFKGGCFLPIPKALKLKRTLVNPMSSGVECFKWAFLAGMHYNDVNGTNREQNSQYKKFEKLYNFSHVNFPASMRDVQRFEKQNSHRNFSLNVFGVYNDDKVLVQYLSKFSTEKNRQVVNLLFVKDETDHPGHIMTITNIQ
jgi:hypothetical protein